MKGFGEKPNSKKITEVNTFSVPISFIENQNIITYAYQSKSVAVANKLCNSIKKKKTKLNAKVSWIKIPQ